MGGPLDFDRFKAVVRGLVAVALTGMSGVVTNFSQVRGDWVVAIHIRGVPAVHDAFSVGGDEAAATTFTARLVQRVRDMR